MAASKALMKIRKATREQQRRHNRQLLMRAIYEGEADNRAALAATTGLAKPTVSDLVAELLSEGFVEEMGLGESTEGGGKRPTLLRFVPEARQVIGIAIDARHVFGLLSNLTGRITCRHYADLFGARGPLVLKIVQDVIDGLIAQLDAPLLTIGVAVAGVVDADSGVITTSDTLGLRDVALADILRERYSVPVSVGNTTELTALAQFAYAKNDHTNARNLVTLLINGGVEVGVAWDYASYHHGGDIGSLHPMTSLDQRLSEFLSWDWVQRRFRELRRDQTTLLPAEGMTYMHLRYACARGDAIASQLVDDLANQIALVAAWIVALLRPDHISLSGDIVDLGDDFLRRIGHKLRKRLAPPLVERVSLSMATIPNLAALGAVAQAIQTELDMI